MSSITRMPMPELHAAAEAIEHRALQDMFDAAPAEVREAMGWRLDDVDSALISCAADTPSILINRTLGLGTDRPATRQSVREICERYREAGVDRFFVHVTREAQPDEVRAWLEEEGLVPQRRWMKFARDARPAAAVSTEYGIARVDAAAGPAFGRVVADAFDLGTHTAGLFPPLVERAGWHLYGAFEGETLVGTGALFVHDGYGYLDFGATAPAYRGRGAQSAVLAARIDAARDLGCTAIFTMTGEEVPGDPQHSYRNIERAGFEPAYLRDNFGTPR